VGGLGSRGINGVAAPLVAPRHAVGPPVQSQQAPGHGAAPAAGAAPVGGEPAAEAAPVSPGAIPVPEDHDVPMGPGCEGPSQLFGPKAVGELSRELGED
jgi:hypothetical protein